MSLFFLGLISCIFLGAFAIRQALPDPRLKTSERSIGKVRGMINFLALVTILLFFWRLPFLTFNREIDSDESQVTAQAMTYLADPLPWSSDGGSVGPLNAYFLLWPSLMGWEISFLTTRIAGLFCVFLTLLFYLKTASAVIGPRLAPLAILPIVAFYLSVFTPHYPYYTSEHLSIALLAVAGYQMIKIYIHPSLGRCYLVGLILGAIPLCKLQVSPLAVYLFGFTLLILLFRKSRRPLWNDAANSIWSIFLGGLTVPVLILTPVFVAGLGGDFFKRYILFGLSYNQSMFDGEQKSSIGTFLWHPIALIQSGMEFQVYFINMTCFIGVALASLYAVRQRLSRRWYASFYALGGYLLITSFVILKPGTLWAHYLLLEIGPLLLIFLWIVRGLIKTKRFTPFIRWPCLLGILYVLMGTVPYFIYREIYSPEILVTELAPIDPAEQAFSEIQRLVHPGDRLAIWGTFPRCFVRTHMPSATRDVVGMAIAPFAAHDFYRQEYLNDIERTQPSVFVDATGELPWQTWLHPLELSRHTMYPPLGAYIAKNYTLVSSVSPTNNNLPILIYLRRDLVK